jgi:hypothetical protein
MVNWLVVIDMLMKLKRKVDHIQATPHSSNTTNFRSAKKKRPSLHSIHSQNVTLRYQHGGMCPKFSFFFLAYTYAFCSDILK